LLERDRERRTDVTAQDDSNARGRLTISYRARCLEEFLELGKVLHSA